MQQTEPVIVQRPIELIAIRGCVLDPDKGTIRFEKETRQPLQIRGGLVKRILESRIQLR